MISGEKMQKTILIFAIAIIVIGTLVVVTVVIQNKELRENKQVSTNIQITNTITENIIAKDNKNTNVINEVKTENVVVSEENKEDKKADATIEDRNVEDKKEEIVTSKTETTQIIESNNKTEENSQKINNESTIETPPAVQQVEEQEQNSVQEQEEQTQEEEQEETRPNLAYSTYREVNTSVVPEVINILNNEISKEQDLVDFGSKAVAGNKASAYSKTSAFTYMLVSDIQKGKVAGNYTKFEQRVRNNVGAYGTYNVYAEDEYTYDGRGLNPKWSQTLVWVYVTF